MHVVFAAPECAPWVKTGGLGEVLGALPAAIAGLGHRVTMYVPYYRQVRDAISLDSHAPGPISVLPSVTIPFADRNRFVRVLDLGEHNRVRLYGVDCPEFFDRDGIYGPPGKNYPDNHLRYGLYCRAVLESCKLLGVPDMFHAHDWQAALIPVLLATTYAADPVLAGSRTVFTIHNGGYQGKFPPAGLRDLLLPLSFLHPGALGDGDEANVFQGALIFSGAITTVSPNYAKELMTPQYGEGMDAIYRNRAPVFTGILNGIDTAAWNPSTDQHLAARYSANDLSGKAACRSDLLRTFGIGDVDQTTAVVGIVSRIAEQKGFDLIAQAMPELTGLNLVLLILGSGEPELEKTFRNLAERYRETLHLNFEFDEVLAHKMTAGADMTLMPSRYEPSGLAQMYSLHYGTVPVVRATGGLTDTVKPGPDGNGFTFAPYTADALVQTIEEALRAFQDKAEWQACIRRGMDRDMDWGTPAKEYVAVYEQALAAKQAHGKR